MWLGRLYQTYRLKADLMCNVIVHQQNTSCCWHKRFEVSLSCRGPDIYKHFLRHLSFFFNLQELTTLQGKFELSGLSMWTTNPIKPVFPLTVWVLARQNNKHYLINEYVLFSEFLEQLTLEHQIFRLLNDKNTCRWQAYMVTPCIPLKCCQLF